MATNNPRASSLSENSDHQLLTLILTELRLQTYLTFQREVREEELDSLRAEIMNDTDRVDTDSTSFSTPFPAIP